MLLVTAHNQERQFTIPPPTTTGVHAMPIDPVAKLTLANDFTAACIVGYEDTRGRKFDLLKDETCLIQLIPGESATITVRVPEEK